MDEQVQKEAEEQFELKVSKMLKASQLCFDNEYWEAGVILLYSLIDAMAWLWRDPSHHDVSSADFIEWVNRYMLPAPGIHVSADDLFGARCGLLHSLTGESRRHRNLQARKVSYRRTVPEGERWIVQIHMAETLEPFSVNVDVLGEAILTAIEKFCDEMNNNPELNERVSQRVFTSYFSEGWMVNPGRRHPGLESDTGTSLGAVVVVPGSSAPIVAPERTPPVSAASPTSEPNPGANDD